MSTFDEIIQNQNKFWFCCRCRADRLSRIFAIISLCMPAFVTLLIIIDGFMVVEKNGWNGTKGNYSGITSTMSTFLGLDSDGSSSNVQILEGGTWLLNIIANFFVLIGYSERKSAYYKLALVLEGVVLAFLCLFPVISLFTIIGLFLLMFFFFWVDFRAYQLIKLEEEWRQNHGPQSVGPVGYAPNSYAVTMPPPADAQYYEPQNYPPPPKYF